MKKTAAFRLTGFLPILFITALSAQPFDYPRLDLTARPVDGDNVTFRLVLGMRSNGCVPTYEDVAFKLDVSPILIYPPQYIITLQYTEIPPDPDLICIQIPTEYGPKVELGQLRLGNYRVMVGDEQVGGFTVGEGGVVKTAAINGVVSEDNRPLEMFKILEGVKVYLQEREPLHFPNPPPWPAYTTIDSTLTGKAGSYALTASTGKTYRLIFSKKGYQTRAVPGYGGLRGYGLNLTGDTVINTALLPEGAAATVEGIVGLIDGPGSDIIELCHECSVSVTFPPVILWMNVQEPLENLPQQIFTAVTDKSGSYIIADVPIGYANQPITVTASKDGYASKSRQQELLPRADATVDFFLEKSFGNTYTVVRDGIAFTVATEKSSYSFGEPVLVKYIVTNNSQKRVRYDFTSGCQYDMQATDVKGVVAHRYLENIGCTDALTELVIETDESVMMEYPAFYLFQPDSLMTITAWLNEHHKETSVSVPIWFSRTVSVAKPGPARLGSSETVGYSRNSGEIHLTLRSFQDISVRAFTLDGRAVRQLTLRKGFPEGDHSIPLDWSGLSGPLVLRVRGEGFSWNQTIRAPMR